MKIHEKYEKTAQFSKMIVSPLFSPEYFGLAQLTDFPVVNDALLTWMEALLKRSEGKRAGKRQPPLLQTEVKTLLGLLPGTRRDAAMSTDCKVFPPVSDLFVRERP